MNDIPSFVTPPDTPSTTIASKPRILLVEDDPISAKLSSNLLAELNAEITHVTKGEEALALFENKAEFDVVLMDLYLPGLNGFKTTEEIRRSDNYRSKPIPIVALTSNPLMEPREKFLKTTGFSDYIMKPPRKDTFAAAVKKHLAAPVVRIANWY